MRIFIGGSSESLETAGALAYLIEAMGHEPISWHEAFVAGEFVFEKLVEVANSVDGAIFVFASDDTVLSRGKRSGQTRDNVLIEYGLFAGTLGPKRCIMCVKDRPKEASDLKGFVYIRFEENRKEKIRVEVERWLDQLESQAGTRRRHAEGPPMVHHDDGLRAKARLVLYAKSAAQLQQNRKDAGEFALQTFLKPHSHYVYSNIKAFGSPDATIVSLDEDWVEPLVEDGRLCNLTNLVAGHRFLSTLAKSGHICGSQWSATHFLDFSYYSLNRHWHGLGHNFWTALRSGNPQVKVEALRSAAKTEHLLLYDFHTPNACACVILEMIESLGAGIESLADGKGLESPPNIRALKVLRLLVGDYGVGEFSQRYPLNLDDQSAKALIVREWHSRMADLPGTIKRFEPIREGIRGTLGGWHLGVLAGPPSEPEALEALEQLLKPSVQMERLRSAAGLPTLATFYENIEFAQEKDPITNWSLLEIREYVDRVIRRSAIPNYRRELRGLLLRLHTEIMTNPAEDTEEIVKNFSSRC